MSLEIIVATNNDHKLNEIKEIFKGYNITLKSLKDENILADPDETGSSYKENALIKAKEISKYTNKVILSDDSGVEIDALGEHKPGIYSHRFAKENGGQEKTNEYVTANFAGSTGRYVCHICVLNLEEKPLHFEGYMEGHVAPRVMGINGFGYDPTFIPNGYDKTVACLSPEIKNKISHRYNALKMVLNYLKANKLI